MTPAEWPDKGSVQWELIIEAITDGLVALGADGKFLYANTAGAAVFGSTPAALKGCLLSDFADQAGDLVACVRRSLPSGVSTEFEVYSPLSDRWLAVRTYPAAEADTVFFQDITDRRAAQDALRVSEAKFAGIVSISADAIISVDADQRIIHFNYGAEDIFGWSAAAVIGQTLDVLLPERFRNNHGQHMRNFAASPVEARRMGERREISGLRRNGQEFPAEASISKLNVGGQQIFTVVLRDATERKQQEQTYRRLYEDAQRAVAMRDDVLSFVSHDLGNPLAAIRIATAVLLKKMDPTAADGKHVTGIRDAVTQAQRLIRDLLDVQKVEAGNLVLHMETVIMDKLIIECLHTLEPLVSEMDVRIERAIAPFVPPFTADPDRILQVISNLIGNAVKFSAPGSTVTISVHAADGELVVSVQDHGPGIPAEELPFVFDRYWQAKKTGKVGHGLGLSIVQAFVKAHDGRVWAESETGVGSRFSFALPVERQEP